MIRSQAVLQSLSPPVIVVSGETERPSSMPAYHSPSAAWATPAQSAMLAAQQKRTKVRSRSSVIVRTSPSWRFTH